ncbi:MAG: TCR/Tet family MFS transporter [Alphaproteobacteria bacterium]|jgi:DHA1 family tetracycline resistance protein-like MFS transporter
MNTRRALAFIFCTVTLDVLALGVMIPVLPRIVLGFMDGDIASAAEVFGLFATVWGAMQFLSSPLLGALSDRYGRRPVILLSCLGLGLDYIFMALAPSLVLLFVGRVISGVTAATISTAFAYIADVTPADGRAKAFGVVGIAFGLGFVLGPAIGGLLGGLDPRLPFWVSAAACLLNAAFGWFVLPESLPPERRMAFSWKRASPLGSLALLRSHTQLLGLAAANFFGQVAHHVLPAVFVLYGAYRYGWGEEIVGFTLAGVGVCSAIVQGLLVGPAVARLGERWAMIVSLLFGAVGMTIYGLAPTGLWFWIGVPVMSLWGLAGPASQSLMSRLVGPSEQGQLQGANTALMSIAGIVAPGLFAITFAYFIEPIPGRLNLPGAPYLVAALLLVVAAVIAARATAQRRLDVPHR